mgnify:CR=1 FL=1
MFPEENTEVPSWLLDLLAFDTMERFLDSSEVKTYFTKASFLPIMKGVIAMLDSNGRFLNTMGTGTGKTAISILICCISSLIMGNVRDQMIRSDDTRKDQMTRDIDESRPILRPNYAAYDRGEGMKRPRKRRSTKDPTTKGPTANAATVYEEVIFPEDLPEDEIVEL